MFFKHSRCNYKIILCEPTDFLRETFHDFNLKLFFFKKQFMWFYAEDKNEKKNWRKLIRPAISHKFYYLCYFKNNIDKSQ